MSLPQDTSASSTCLPVICSDASLYTCSNLHQSQFSLINQNIFIRRTR